MDILLEISSIHIANKIVKYLPSRFTEPLYAEYKHYICAHSLYYKIPWNILPEKLRKQYIFSIVQNELIWNHLDGIHRIYHHPKYGTVLYFEWDFDYVCLLDSIYSYCHTYNVDHEVIMLDKADYPEIEIKFNINLDICTFHARKIGGCTFIIVGEE